MTDGLSAADLAAIQNGNNGMFGGDGAWWIIILFLFAFASGWGNGGFGGGGSGAYQNYVLNSDFATLQRQIDSGFSGVERRTDAIINGICDSSYTNAQLINGLQMAEMQNTNALQAQLAQCCCDNREAIAGVNYNMATQACDTRQTIQSAARDIIDNQSAGDRAILEAIKQMEINAKDDKIAALTAQVAALQAEANNACQTNRILSAINPPVMPAYVVPNPNAGLYGNCGCGCN